MSYYFYIGVLVGTCGTCSLTFCLHGYYYFEGFHEGIVCKLRNYL